MTKTAIAALQKQGRFFVVVPEYPLKGGGVVSAFITKVIDWLLGGQLTKLGNTIGGKRYGLE